MDQKLLTTTNEMVIDEKTKVEILTKVTKELIKTLEEEVGEIEAEEIARKAVNKWMKLTWDGNRKLNFRAARKYIRKAAWYEKGHYQSLKRSQTLSLDAPIKSEKAEEGGELMDTVDDPLFVVRPWEYGMSEDQRKEVRWMLVRVFKEMRISDRNRKVFIGKFWGNAEYEDLAKEFDITVNNCEQIIFRVKRAFAKRFNREYIEERFALCA